MLPNTIKGALESPVVCDLVLEVGKAAVSRLIELELVKLAAAVSVGGSLDNYKVQLIATQMVEFFPNESIADFKVCFFRASAGQYGDIFRLDGIIVRKFMEKYLEEKYQAIEEKLMSERESHPYAPISSEGKKLPPFDLLEEFKKQVAKQDIADQLGYKDWSELEKSGNSELISNALNQVSNVASGKNYKIPAMSREEVLQNGQSEPPKRTSTGAQPMTPEEVEAWYRNKYPTATDDQIQSLIYTGKLC